MACKLRLLVSCEQCIVTEVGFVLAKYISDWVNGKYVGNGVVTELLVKRALALP